MDHSDYLHSKEKFQLKIDRRSSCRIGTASMEADIKAK